jgi:hypothetical protein
MVERGMKALPEKVAHMTEANEEEVAQVGGKKDVVRRILPIDLFNLCPWFVPRLVSIVLESRSRKSQTANDWQRRIVPRSEG